MLPRTLEKVSLAIGESKNYHHVGCNNRKTSKSLSVKREKHGHVYHCFKCGESGFHRDVYFRAGTSTRGSGNSSEDEGTSLWPPTRTDISGGFSEASRKYLGRYGLDPSELVDEILEFQFGPRRSLGFRTARAYVERTLEGPGPKWLSHGKQGDFYLRGRGDILFLTEDWISARLVSNHAPAMATLGTQVHDQHLRVIRRFLGAVIWYDDDSSIVKKQQLAACIKIQAYIPCTVVHTGTDPKNTPDRIMEEVENARDYFV